VTIDYMASDDCGQSAECSATFSVEAAPELSVVCPEDVVLNPCLNQEEVDLAFGLWIEQFQAFGGCNTITNDLSIYSAPPASGGALTITFEAQDDCGQSVACSATFGVMEPPAIELICAEDFAVCCDAQPVNLSLIEEISPKGGEFSGSHVSIIDDEYYFTPDCNSTGNYAITYTYTEPDFGCQYACSFTITVSPFPTVDAGINDSIFNDETYLLGMAEAVNAAALQWSTSGDGTFSDTTALNPVYTPGTADIANGDVELCLTAVAFDGCQDVTSCITLTLLKTTPESVITPVCINLTLEEGQTFQRKIKIENFGFVPLNYSISTNVPWLALIDPASGAVPARDKGYVRLLTDATGMAVGIYSTDIIIVTDDPENTEISVPVTLTVAESINGQSIYLAEGWSYISSYIEPENSDLSVIFESQNACSTLNIMLDSNGIYWPVQNINTVGDWNRKRGYKLKMYIDDQLIMTGEESEDRTVNIPAGSSVLPVLSACPVPTMDVLGQINGDYNFVFDLLDGLIYWPEGGIYTLNNLLPGRGYLISMKVPGTINYTECTNFKSFNQYLPKEDAGLPYKVAKTGSHHIISIFAEVLSEFETGDIIAAFNSENDCVGISQINDLDKNLALIIYGNDFTTPATDGMMENEKINLRVIKAGTGFEYDVNFDFDPTLPDHLPYFKDLGMSRITKLYSNADTQISGTSASVKLHPNPARNEFFVTIDNIESPAATIGIFNLDGRQISTAFTDQASTSFNVSHLQPGVYIVNIRLEGRTITKRLIIQ